MILAGATLYVRLASSLAIAALTYVFAIIIYRLYFHPFAKYPGPFLARTSYLYAYYQARRGDTPIIQHHLHERYGPVVRYNPDALIFNTPESLRAIYGANRNFSKGKAYAPMNLIPETPNLAFTPHKAEHARRRRILAPGFSERAAKEQQEYIKTHLNTLCDLLLGDTAASGWSKPTNVATTLSWLGIDISTDLVFGESLDLLHSSEFRFVPQAIARALLRNGLIHQVPFLFKPGMGKWLDYSTWFMRGGQHDMARMQEVAVRTAMKRYEDPPKQERKDVLGYMINTTDPETGTQFTPQDVIVESLILLLAGGETIATLLGVLLFYISRTPDALDKLATEVRAEFKDAADVQLGERMQRCVYVRAYVKEALRLGFGPAFYRDAGPGGAWVGDVFIPEGLTAGTSLCGLETNKDVYPQPFKCVPERWIVGAKTPWGTVTSAADVKAAQAAQPAFSYGPRACAAKTLAYEIMHLMLATLVVRADFKKADGPEGGFGGGRKNLGWPREDEDVYQLYGNFTVKGDGPMMQFRPAVR